MAGSTGSNSQLHGWERILLVLFGGVLAGTDLGSTPLAMTVRVLGWLVILAAIGVVEILMAVYYRTKRRRAGS